MRNIFLTIMIVGLVFAANTLGISSAEHHVINGTGNVTFTISYDFADAVAGFQFDLLTDGFFMLDDASGGAAAETGFMLSTNASGTAIGFSLAGASIAAGAGDLVTLMGTYDVANNGSMVSVTAVEDCDSDGNPSCDNDDTRMVLSDASATVLESSFTSYSWTIGEGVLDNEQPLTYALSANYPNPFNPSTTIDYSIANAGEVSIVVYDMMGRHIRTLVSNFETPGSYDVVWDAKNDEGLSVSAGMYVYKMVSGDFVEVNKMLLVK